MPHNDGTKNNSRYSTNWCTSDCGLQVYHERMRAGGLMGLVAHGSQDVYLNNENKLQSEINNLQSEENKLKSEVDSLQSEVNEMKSGSNNGSDSNTR